MDSAFRQSARDMDPQNTERLFLVQAKVEEVVELEELMAVAESWEDDE